LLKKIIKPEIFAAVLFLFTFVWFFLIKPVISVADNGDFDRLMFSVGLGKFDDSFYSYAQIKYKIAHIIDFGVNGYITTHAICAYIAKILNILFYSMGIFDVRFLSLIYTFAVVSGVYMLVCALKTERWYIDYPMVLLFWFMLCDAGYIPYMNSLYGEGSSYSFLILLLGISAKVIKENPKKRNIVLLFIAYIMFLGSKLQYSLLFPLTMLFFIPLGKFNKINKKQFLWGFIILFVMNVAIYLAAPRGLAEDTIYNSIFYGILKNSDDIHKDSQILNVDEEYEYLAGTNAYTEGTPRMNEDPEFHKNFYSKVSRTRVLKYYMTHIPKFIKMMELSSDASFDNIRGMFGNYTIEEGRSPNETNKVFTFYNTIKQKYFPKSFILLFIYFTLYFSLIIYTLIRNKEKQRLDMWFMLMLIMIGVAQFPLPVLGNGEADIAKQLYIFNMIFDISLIFAIYKGITICLIIKKE